MTAAARNRSAAPSRHVEALALQLQPDVACARINQAVHTADQRSLAGARGADDGGEPAMAEAEVHRPQDRLARRVFLGQPADLEGAGVRGKAHFLPLASKASRLNFSPAASATSRTMA